MPEIGLLLSRRALELFHPGTVLDMDTRGKVFRAQTCRQRADSTQYESRTEQWIEHVGSEQCMSDSGKLGRRFVTISQYESKSLSVARQCETVQV